MTKYCIAVAFFGSMIGNAQTDELDPKILKEEQATVAEIISNFSTLDGLYFDQSIEQHFYNQVAGFNYLYFPNDPNSVLLHQVVIDSLGELRESNSSYCSANLFRDKEMLKQAIGGRIFAVEVDTTLSNTLNRKTYNYSFAIGLVIDKNGKLETVDFLFTISYGRVVMLQVIERPYYV
ncbi:MAG: hypothetical protein ACK45H_02125 [Bacteroidota bacterium]|jgi:hypothetical protein